jgi:predicted SAM-dependent methyltransferase
MNTSAQAEEFLSAEMIAKRRELSSRYIEGQGIETGALHLPLWVSEQAFVHYVDRLSVSDLRKHYPELNQYNLVNVDIVDNGETLSSVADNSLDFIIANHFLEHCENPLGTIRTHLSKLRHNGILYYAVPDKCVSFDKDRPLTSFEHLIRDDQEGIETSRSAHYQEWAQFVCNYTSPEAIASHAEKLSAMSYSIHFHVWNFPAFSDFLAKAQSYLHHTFKLEQLQQNYSEIIAILRKVSDAPPVHMFAEPSVVGAGDRQKSASFSEKELGQDNAESFNYCIDLPIANQEITLPYLLVSGWISSSLENTLDQPALSDATRSFVQPLTMIPRPDVRNVYPQCQVLGFHQYVSLLHISDHTSLQIEFLINGKSHSFPMLCPVSAETITAFRTQKSNKLNRIRPYLRCPVCQSDFKQLLNHLECSECHLQFEQNLDHYNLLTSDLIQHASIKSTANVSTHGYDDVALAIINQFPDGLILDNGCGLRNFYYENVVNFEIVNYPTTDVLGIGEKLPFKSNSFDAVFSLAVLEHVKHPFECAKEIIRVLKPGGKLYAVVPFLQPFHGYPDHYYNMTGSGLKNLFDEALQIIDSGVPLSGLPIWCLSWFLNAYIRGLPEHIAQQFKEMKVSDLLSYPSSYLAEDFVTQLSFQTNEELACTNYIVAVKAV